jgi:hypothetical protein
VLEYHLGGRDISEVLAMSVTEAEEFFGAGHDGGRIVGYYVPRGGAKRRPRPGGVSKKRGHYRI